MGVCVCVCVWVYVCGCVGVCVCMCVFGIGMGKKGPHTFICSSSTWCEGFLIYVGYHTQMYFPCIVGDWRSIVVLLAWY